MKLTVHIFLLLNLGLTLVSCGDKAKDKVASVSGTTVSQLKKLFGQPKRVDSIDNQQVFVYSEDKKYQVVNEKVVAEFRAPFDEEKSLLYWKHFCRDEETTLLDLERKNENHQKPEQEFSCKTSKVTVIYDPNVDKVVRVINYGP